MTRVYELPLLLLVSWRGVYKEAISAQIPLGQRLPKILEAIDVGYDLISEPDNLDIIQKAADEAYGHSRTHAILLSPKIWENEKAETSREAKVQNNVQLQAFERHGDFTRQLTRFEVLKSLASYLENRIVICNLGIPSKELYEVRHQKSNFYMLGSMGLASSIGLGTALFTKKEVVVIDGDGSLLMNLGLLSTISVAKPQNLTILAIDNGVHGSTGNQATATSHGVDLELIARGCGFARTYKAASREEIVSTVHGLKQGPNFVHILAKPGNVGAPNIPLTPIEIKQNLMEALQA